MNSKKDLILYIYDQYVESQEWIEKVPREISDAFFDNPYLHSRGRIILALEQYIFTEEEREWIDWLTFEWNESPYLKIKVDGIEYSFDSFEQGLDKFFELGLIRERVDG